MSSVDAPHTRNISFERMVAFLGVASLFLTFSGYTPLSAVFTALLPVTPLLIAANTTLPTSIIFLILTYFYFTIRVLTYLPESFLDPEFYRRDGNFFITFAPLLILGMMSLRTNVETICLRFVYFVAIIYLLVTLFGMATMGTIGAAAIMFSAHNAFGGFLADVAAVCLALAIIYKRRWFWLLFIFYCVLFAITLSRGSMIGLGLGTLFVLSRSRWLKFSLLAGAVVVTVGIALTTFLLISDNTSQGIIRDINIAVGSFSTGRLYTVVDRAFNLWPRAVYLWVQSPIFGTGFGSYNDMEIYSIIVTVRRFEEFYTLTGIPGLFAQVSSRFIAFDSAHAHHSLLHILAETGIVGAALMIAFIVTLYHDIKYYSKGAAGLATRIMLLGVIFASFTEHRLTTPAQMMPITLLAGIIIMDGRARLNKRGRSAAVIPHEQVPTSPA